MTITEICDKFAIGKEEIEFYEKNGLIVRHFAGEYTEEDLKYLGKIKTLLSAGVKSEAIRTYLRHLDNNDIESQIRCLRSFRASLLEKIHGKQQDLDRIDYAIYQLSKK